jgi:DNA-binding transcriptional regulator WhiA
LGYKIDDAAKNLLRLAAEFEDDDRALSLYQIEVALRLPHSDEKLAKSIIEHRGRRLEEAAQRRKTETDQSS